MQLDNAVRPDKTVKNLNVIFTKSAAALEEFFKAFELSSAHFKSLSTLHQILQCLRCRHVLSYADYLPIWFLMEMEHDDRNMFLQLTDRTTIEDHKMVRNVSELLQFSKKHWPNITSTLEGFPEIAAPLDVTHQLAISTDMVKERFEHHKWSLETFLSIKSVGALFAWLENNAIKYKLHHPYIWIFLGMNEFDRETVRECLILNARSSEFFEISAADEELFCFEDINPTADIRSYQIWVAKILNELENFRRPELAQLSHHEEVMEILELAVIEVRHNTLFSRIDAWLLPRTYFGDPELLHMVDNEQREEILDLFGLTLGDIEDLREYTELEWLLHQRGVTESRNVKQLEPYWECFDTPADLRTVPRPWLTRGSLSMKTMTTIGQFLEWMYLSHDDIQSEIYQAMNYLGRQKEKLDHKWKCVISQQAILDIHKDIERIHTEIENRKETAERKKAKRLRKAKKMKSRKQRKKGAGAGSEMTNKEQEEDDFGDTSVSTVEDSAADTSAASDDMQAFLESEVGATSQQTGDGTGAKETLAIISEDIAEKKVELKTCEGDTQDITARPADVPEATDSQEHMNQLEDTLTVPDVSQATPESAAKVPSQQTGAFPKDGEEYREEIKDDEQQHDNPQNMS